MSTAERSVLKALVRPISPAVIAIVFLSFFTTLLNLVPSIYMMQLSERVMLSRNETTLIFLTIIAVFLVIVMIVIDAIRYRILRRVSVALDQHIGQRVFDIMNRQELRVSGPTKSLILGDLNTFRDFIGGATLINLLDLVWIPMILAVMFMLHLVLGLTLVAIVVATMALTALNQTLVAANVKQSQTSMAKAAEFARAVTRTADAIRVMGMLPTVGRRWYKYHSEALDWQFLATARSEPATGGLQFLRNSQQIILMTVGVSLYLLQQISAGAAFAVVFIGVRAIIPIVAVGSSWRLIWNFLGACERLNAVLSHEQGDAGMTLPRPAGRLTVSRIMLTPPNAENVVLNDVSFSLQSGRVLGVVGPSGAGKSSLAKLLIGAWRPRRGSISIDDHDFAHWNQDQLGRHIGYVPQEIEFLPGTVAENIARFQDDGPIDHAAVLEAAELSEIQDVIQKLPGGYNTRIGFDGHSFSGGQRQRIALARALYGNPSLLVLDEPNSNLDTMGEQSLGRTLTALKNRKVTIVIVTHRLNMLNYCDDVLVMNAGTVHAFGPREMVLSRLSAYRPTQPAALASVTS